MYKYNHCKPDYLVISSSMEKQTKAKNNIFKLLPKAASAINFQNPPFSPSRDRSAENCRHRFKALAGRGFSGPIFSIIPDEARREKNGNFETQEPTSPKVSCLGQIKRRKKMKRAKRAVSLPKDLEQTTPAQPEATRRPTAVQKLFTGVKLGRKTDRRDQKPPLPNRAPSLSQMKRFASGRGGLANFDWTAQIAPENLDRKEYHSDEEIEQNHEEEEEFKVPFSAPMIVGDRGVSLQARKEVNLWKRRTMAPPMPLKLNN